MHDHAHNQEKVTFSWGILHWRSTFGKCQCAQGLGLFTAGDLISRNQHRDKITARANWVLYDWLKELVEISTEDFGYENTLHVLWSCEIFIGIFMRDLTLTN